MALNLYLVTAYVIIATLAVGYDFIVRSMKVSLLIKPPFLRSIRLYLLLLYNCVTAVADVILVVGGFALLYQILDMV